MGELTRFQIYNSNMPEYRRSRVDGGTYFFTVVTYQRQPILSIPFARNLLHETWIEVQTKHPFRVDAICLLPDHIHCIWTLPENDSDYSIRLREIKRIFSHHYATLMKPVNIINSSRQKRQERTIWQRRFWEHTIRDENDMENHVNYIHYNPVKHGYVSKPADWKWSGFRRHVKMGLYEKEWGDQDKSLRSCFPRDFE